MASDAIHGEASPGSAAAARSQAAMARHAASSLARSALQGDGGGRAVLGAASTHAGRTR
jgi:hypothetical protein